MVAGGSVVVVGGGIAGASVALHLSDGGADVVVVDAAREGRATLAGAGIVAPPWRDPGSALSELRAGAVAAYPDLADRLGGGLDVVGELYVGLPGAAFDAMAESLAAAAPHPVTPMGGDEARSHFPYLADGLAGLWSPVTARVDGEDLRRRLLDAAVAAGAEVVGGRAELDPGRNGGLVVTIDGRRLPAEAVVVAAGAWSAAFVASAGVTLAVEPQRGQIIHLGVAGDTASMCVVQPIGADHYLLPFADRRVVVGRTRETGAGFDPRLTAGGVSRVLADALGVAPGLAGATIREMRVGLRPVTPDGLPLLGPVPGCPGLWAATGMGAQGLTLGPFCGRLVADTVLGRPTDVDLAPFDPDRFA